MSSRASTDWHQANDRFLMGSLARISRLLSQAGHGEADLIHSVGEVCEYSRQAPPALVVLCETFGLSTFERDLLLLAAGPDLDPELAGNCAAACGDAQRPYPTFALALQVLPEADWGALAPDRALRYWRLLEIGSGPTLANSPLLIAERVLHYLRGVQTLDEQLAGVVTPLVADETLVPSHSRIAERLADAWSSDGPLPVVQLCGEDVEGKRAIAAAACSALGLAVNVVPAQALPVAPSELDGLLRLLGREAALGHCATLLDCDRLDPGDSARAYAVTTMSEELRGPLVMASREQRRLCRRLSLPLHVDRPTAAEQASLWQVVLGAAGDSLNGQVQALTAQFNLDAGAIRSAAVAVTGSAMSSDRESRPEQLQQALWQACLAQARPDLDTLAQRIRPAVGWDDLVLPEPKLRVLHDIAIHVRQRSRVYEDWGFAARSSLGLGISALFAGPSGTGKTLAAEVLAHKLELDLYRIDLASVVSKYIGETEKNLKQVFDAAESGGAILLFDEADALFGKRSEIKDSHDRYANIEVSYLLQRMEAYRGLAILTTNMQGALDTAFLRRIRFIVQFPFPEPAHRAEIWRRIFPAETPTHGLDAGKLASLAVAGGSIRNIALGAAFLAAEDGAPVTMEQVLAAARNEYAKLEKPLTVTEIGGWQQ
jgi:hypothetical protein